MSQTKKVKSTGRFGSRYGVGIRKRVLKVEAIQKQKTACPNCGGKKLKRIDRGLFLCPKCRAEIAGGTFVSQTLSGGIIKKMVSQKKFLPLAKELLEVKEKQDQTPLEKDAQKKESEEEKKG